MLFAAAEKVTISSAGNSKTAVSGSNIDKSACKASIDSFVFVKIIVVRWFSLKQLAKTILFCEPDNP